MTTCAWWVREAGEKNIRNPNLIHISHGHWAWPAKMFI